MNTYDAYSVLGVSEGATEREIDKAFRKKAAKLHPDVNKADTAEADFKKLNEAYQLLKNPHQKQPYIYYNSKSDPYTNLNMDDLRTQFEDIFGGKYDFFGFGKRQDWQYRAHRSSSPQQQIYKSIRISFVESVVGGSVKEIEYEADFKCTNCNSMGVKYDECSVCHGDSWIDCRDCKGGENAATCPTCHGRGKIKTICSYCKGTGEESEYKSCTKCNGVGTLKNKCVEKIKIPAGTLNGHKIIRKYCGNYNKDSNKYDDLVVTIYVDSDNELQPAGIHITSVVDLSLLEALTGVTKDVRTAYGEKKLKIPAGRKHGDRMEAIGLGYQPAGKHIFILKVDYPENTDKLIEFLSKDGYIADHKEN